MQFRFYLLFHAIIIFWFNFILYPLEDTAVEFALGTLLLVFC